MILVQLTASKQRQRGRSLRAMTASKSQGNKTCVCNRRQKTLLKDYTEYKSQTPEERQTVQNQICHATLLLFFFKYCNKILFTHKSLSLFEQGTMSTIIT